MRTSEFVKKNWFSLVIAVPSIALVILETSGIQYSPDPTLNTLYRVIATRFVGCLVFIPLAIYMKYNVFGLVKENRAKVLLCTLVPLAVVVNNFPIIGVISGNAYVTAPDWYIAIFALEALMIGLFEEFAFRGVLLPFVLENRATSRKSIFWATVISSAAFGGIHIFNLFAGAGIGGVLLQVCYSFLIGGMCAIVLLYTGCIWICVLLHAIYDFCGYLIPTLGEGIIWDPATVAITTVLGVFALVFMLIWLSRITPEKVQRFYSKNNKKGNAPD